MISNVQQKVQKLMNDWYKVQVTKFESYNLAKVTVKKQGQDDVDENKLKQLVAVTPIEDLGIEKTPFDTHVLNNHLKQPLLIEIKEIRNVSKPFQRAIEDEGSVAKKNSTFQLKAHDGQRFLKILLLFDNQNDLVRNIFEINKFCLYDAFISPVEPTTLVLDSQEQITMIYNDKSSGRLTEAYASIQGLPIKYTSAPRFVFLNDTAGEEGEKQEQEQEDEFSDLYKQFNIADISGSERTFIKRFEQLGFRRKKFNNNVKEQ